MKKNIIYISIDKEGFFQAEGKTRSTTVALRSDDIKSVIGIIEGVNNSLWILSHYKEKAVPFIENKITFNKFLDSIGGRDKLTYPKKLLPIKIK